MITRTQLKKELVAERKRMRAQQGESIFMNRTRNIFRHQRELAEELKQVVAFELDVFRIWAKRQLESGCHYCGVKLTAKKMCFDHWMPIVRGGEFTLVNLRACCPPCNFQKGAMDGEQFMALRVWIEAHLAEPERTDFKRRLTIGGRWAPR